MTECPLCDLAEAPRTPLPHWDSGVYVARIDRPADTPGSPLFRSKSEAVFVPTSGREHGVLLSVNPDIWVEDL